MLTIEGGGSYNAGINYYGGQAATNGYVCYDVPYTIGDSSFSKGDRIQNVAPPIDGNGNRNSNRGKTGKVVGFDFSTPYHYVQVKYDDGCVGAGGNCDYKKINDKTMQNIGTLAKKLVSADTQTLIKAGYISSNLELTEKGVRAVTAAAFDTYMVSLVADAQAELDAEAKG